MCKLEKLKIKPFGGSAIEWPEFAELFDRAVHRNPSFDDGMKLIVTPDGVITS